MRPTEVDWQVHESQLVVDNHKQFVADCHKIHDKFKQQYPDKDSTWAYGRYNVFALASPMPLWYDLYSDLSYVIRGYITSRTLGTHKPLWLQSWLNFHKADEVLEWHNHEWPYHGYISIDPHNTTTKFEGYKIENKIGRIYIGPGNRQHKVKVNEDFDSTRITLGFDVTDQPQESPSGVWSLMPLL